MPKSVKRRKNKLAGRYRNRWPDKAEISGRMIPKWVADSCRNRWPDHPEIRTQVLRVKNDGIGDFDPETADEYSFTSLPLVPNIRGYFNISVFLDVLRDEIKKRAIDSAAIAACENKLKVAWVLNSFYYGLKKLLEPDDVILSLGNYEELSLLVDRFTPRQLRAIGFGAVNFVFGNMGTYGFGLQTASERVVPRLLKSLKEFSHADFKGMTYGRPKIQTFHLEQVLLWVDGVSPEIRFN